MSRRAENPVIDELARAAKLDKPTAELFHAAGRARVYGPFFDRMAKHALTQDQVSARSAATALSHTAIAYNTSDNRYHAENPQALSGEALERHQANVLAGKEELLPEDAWLTVEHGRAQTALGNKLADAASPQTRRDLQLLHYGTLFRGGGDRPTTINYDDIESLSHLSLCNLAIGQIEGGISEFLARPEIAGRQRIIDIGAGRYGHTTKAVIKEMGKSGLYPQTAYTVMETAAEFYAKLIEEFTAANSLGLEFRHNPPLSDGISEFGTFTTLNADAVTAIKKLDFSKDTEKNDVTVVIANYSFHCLPQSQKTEMLEHLAQLPNVIVLAGDALESTHEVNRGFHGLAANIGHDMGNPLLTDAFERIGYRIVDQRGLRPETLSKEVNDKLATEQARFEGRGSRLWIAFKGVLAEQALRLIPVAA